MPRQYLIQDPYHLYACRFIELIHRKYGFTAVCFHTDPAKRAFHEGAFPILRSPAIAAHHEADLRDLGALAAKVKKLYDVAGIVPFNEECVLAAGELSERLGLGWNDFETIRRFRDKVAMKDHLRRNHPAVRMNASRLVRSEGEVFDRAFPRYGRFVIKPNDGMGNRDIGVFPAETPRESVAAFFRERPGVSFALEEYIEGPEYFVNGQVDVHGAIEVVAVFRYQRIPVNGCPAIDFETTRIRRADPAFAALERYAIDVVRASGLRRSPFHLEASVDPWGPCLIEVGARLAGNGNALVCHALHGDALDLFDVAAHDYLTAARREPLSFDWARYDLRGARYVHGVATRAETIYSVEGIDDVEALPSFHSWVKKPLPGDDVARTIDIRTMPWCVVLYGEDGALPADAVAARAALKWNASPAPSRFARPSVEAVATRARRAVRWRVVRLSYRVPALAKLLSRVTSLVTTSASRIATNRARAVRRLQQAGVVRRRRGRQETLTPSRVDLANAVLEWARDYLAQPHPMLGRKGPVCPFIQRTLNTDRFHIAFEDEVDGSDANEVRDVLLAHAASFIERFPPDSPDSGFTSVLIVFSAIGDERLAVLDQVHEDTKSFLMHTKHLMVSAFHKDSMKPAMWNPSFHVLSAPFPCFALRPMDVRDIVFLENNRAAFETYHARFATQFEHGKVSNEFGYVDMFRRAKARFG